MKRIALIAVCVLSPVYSNAHTSHGGMEYSAYCCSGSSGGVAQANTGDCQPIPSKSVKVTSRGYEVTLTVGDHHMVTRDHKWVVPFADAKVSTDGEYHGCLFPTEDTLRCFYAPPQSY